VKETQDFNGHKNESSCNFKALAGIFLLVCSICWKKLKHAKKSLVHFFRGLKYNGSSLRLHLSYSQQMWNEE